MTQLPASSTITLSAAYGPRVASPCALTVVVPCYNERATVLSLLERVKALAVDKEVFVIDNCSTDGTREMLKAICRDERPLTLDGASASGIPDGVMAMTGEGFTLILQRENRGKSASVQLGFELARGRYVICQDADLEYEPADILRLLAVANASGAPVIFGSRFARMRRQPLTTFQVGRTALTLAFDLLYGATLTDVSTCYKLVRTDIARTMRCRSTGFDLDFELPARLRLAGYRIAEVPVHYTPRTRSTGKKITWYDGLSAARLLVALRFGALGRARFAGSPRTSDAPRGATGHPSH